MNFLFMCTFIFLGGMILLHLIETFNSPDNFKKTLLPLISYTIFATASFFSMLYFSNMPYTVDYYFSSNSYNETVSEVTEDNVTTTIVKKIETCNVIYDFDQWLSIFTNGDIIKKYNMPCNKVDMTLVEKERKRYLENLNENNN